MQEGPSAGTSALLPADGNIGACEKNISWIRSGRPAAHPQGSEPCQVLFLQEQGAGCWPCRWVQSWSWGKAWKCCSLGQILRFSLNIAGVLGARSIRDVRGGAGIILYRFWRPCGTGLLPSATSHGPIHRRAGQDPSPSPAQARGEARVAGRARLSPIPSSFVLGRAAEVWGWRSGSRQHQICLLAPYGADFWLQQPFRSELWFCRSQ